MIYCCFFGICIIFKCLLGIVSLLWCYFLMGVMLSDIAWVFYFVGLVLLFKKIFLLLLSFFEVCFFVFDYFITIFGEFAWQLSFAV